MVFPGIVALAGVDRFRFVILWETWIYHHAAFRSSAPWWLCRVDQESAKPRQKTFDRYAFQNSNYLMHNHFSEMLQSDTHLSQPPESIDLHSPQGPPPKICPPAQVKQRMHSQSVALEHEACDGRKGSCPVYTCCGKACNLSDCLCVSKTDENFLQDFPQQIPKGTLFLKEDHGLRGSFLRCWHETFFPGACAARVAGTCCEDMKRKTATTVTTVYIEVFYNILHA